jgi:hypothetical protein
MGTLVGWWKGENNTVDSVNGNNAVITAGVGYGDGQVNRCFLFDGSIFANSGTITIPYSQLLQFGSTVKFTIEFWFKRGLSSFQFGRHLYNEPYKGNWDGLAFTLSGDGSYIDLGSDGNFYKMRYATILDESIFYNVKIVYDGNSVWNLYINNVLQTPNDRVNWAFSDSGRGEYSFTRFDAYCGASIDEIKTYNDSQPIPTDSILDLESCGTSTIFNIRPEWSREPNMEIQFGRELIQYDAAMTQFRFLTSELGWKVTAEYFNIDKAVEYSLLDFFHQRKGKLSRFWLPAWAQYFTLAQDISPLATTFFLAEDNSFQYVYRGYERFFMLLKNGHIITRKITASLGNGEYSVASAFDRAITPADISLFGKLLLVRFDQDEIAMQHDTTDLSTCTLTFQELAKEYL